MKMTTYFLLLGTLWAGHSFCSIADVLHFAERAPTSSIKNLSAFAVANLIVVGGAVFYNCYGNQVKTKKEAFEAAVVGAILVTAANVASLYIPKGLGYIIQPLILAYFAEKRLNGALAGCAANVAGLGLAQLVGDSIT